MTQKAGDGGDIGAARDQEAGIGVSETVDAQVFRQSVGVEDFLESPCEGAGCHGQGKSLTAEDVVVIGELPLFMSLCFPLADLMVLRQQAFHFRGEVDVPVAGGRFRLLDLDFLACDLDHVAADVELVADKVEVAPLEAAAFATSNARGNEQLEVGFVLDAFLLQRTDEPYNCFFIRDGFFLFLSCVLVCPPSRVAIDKTALHGVGEDSAQTTVQALYRRFGERFSRFAVFRLAHICVKLFEVLRPEFHQFVVPQMGTDAGDVLLLPVESGRGQLIRRDGLQPDVDVLVQGDGTIHVRRELLAGNLE